MRKNLFVLASALFTVFAFVQTSKAQSNSEEADFMQSIFGMEKKAVVADFLEIESNAPFWALYDEYETKRKDLGKERLAVLTDYAENYDKLTDAKYDAVISSMIKLRKSNDKLTDTYYKKIKKASGSKVAAQFFQLEAYFSSQIRATIMEEIPYIGEFDN
jgi:hypothetical protein